MPSSPNPGDGGGTGSGRSVRLKREDPTNHFTTQRAGCNRIVQTVDSSPSSSLEGTILPTKTRLLAYLVLLISCFFPNLFAQNPTTGAISGRHLPRIRVDDTGHFLQTEDGKPFFWLGDTAWQLVHDTTREECSYYLHVRARQGYTVIQTVVLTEFGGLDKPSALGLRPFVDNDPLKPVEAYFDRVDEIVHEAESLGLYVALVPAWGDKLTAPWGTGPRIFRNDNLPVAHSYARYLGAKLKAHTNIIWVLGGDRPARIAGMNNDYLLEMATTAGFSPDQDWTPIWREFAAGLAEGTGTTPLITYHPQGGPESSSVMLHNERWLSINGMQSGHGGGHDIPVWEWVARDYALNPTKPTLDLEPNYEDHPYNPWPRWDPSTGYFRDYDVRKQTYRSVFAGAAGVTYGHHAVWGFVGARNDVVNFADRDWIDALYRPAGRQMEFLKDLMLSRPYFSRIPDQSLIAGDPGKGGLHLQATRDKDGRYVFVYFPMNDQTATLDLRKLPAKRWKAWWYDPRTGIATLIGYFDGGSTKEFRTPAYGPDWVLVLDDATTNFPLPGLEACCNSD
jgi:Protein of unknown function (DUF4038)/Putative collagen-binding domain of a collagenase